MICFVTLAGRGQAMPENVRGCPISKKSSQPARANETGLPQPADGPEPSEKSPNEPTVLPNFRRAAGVCGELKAIPNTTAGSIASCRRIG